MYVFGRVSKIARLRKGWIGMNKRLLVVIWLLAFVMAVATGYYLVAAYLALVLVVALAAPRLSQARTTRADQISKAREHTRWPKLLGEIIKFDKGEKVLYESRMHPAVIFSNWWLTLPLAMIVVGLLIQEWILIPVAFVAAVAITARAAIDWWFTRRSFTTWRVIVATGIIRQDKKSVELKNIEVLSSSENTIQNKLLRLLGLSEVWHWHFDTQIQKDPFNDLKWTAYPSPVGDILETHLRKEEQSNGAQ